MRCITSQISKQIWCHWGSYGQKTTQKQSQIILSAATENFWNLKTREVQIWYKWNLHDICTTLAPFVYCKLRMSIEGQQKASRKNYVQKPLNYQNLDHHLKHFTKCNECLNLPPKQGVLLSSTKYQFISVF